MLRVGLTGGIGSGKTTVARRLAELGAVVIDADAVAREIMEPGQPVLQEVRESFGDKVIRADGTLDYPDEVLAELELVIASLHTALSQPREQVTDRLLKAIRNPHVDIIGHPTGRLLPDRPGADLDMDAIIAAAAETGTILEINANPSRLDLRDVHVKMAVEAGVRLSINTDAHHPDHFDFRQFGVATAQRGWASTTDVVNTWEIERLEQYVNRSGK